MKTKWFVITALSVSFALGRLASATAEHEHMEGEEKTPATISGIWSEVKEHEEELGKIIADKKLDKVHEAAFEIRDLVNSLHDKSINLLSTDKLVMVNANAKDVADIATRLDESGDAGDQAATEANFKKLQGFLKTINAQYPQEMVKMYVCPMDGYTSDKPGKCPLCGMNLKEKEMTAADAQSALDKAKEKKA